MESKALTKSDIIEALKQVEVSGPLFDLFQMHPIVLARVHALAERVKESSRLHGVRMIENKWLPETLIAARDTDGNYWTIDLETQEVRKLSAGISEESFLLRSSRRSPAGSWLADALGPNHPSGSSSPSSM